MAEDNTTNQLVIARMLEKWGCKFQVVANGNEVIAMLRDASFDLILMDCQMPEMDGYTASKLIRQSRTIKNSLIPIIALTANVVTGDEEKCREAGMNEYLSKPINKLELEKMLRRYLVDAKQKVGKKLISEETLSQFDVLQMAGQPDIYIEVIDSFLKSSRQRIEALRKHIETKDMLNVEHEAHSLRSSALTLGAIDLGVKCQLIEDIATATATGNIDIIFENLVELHSQSCEELTAIKVERESHLNKKAAA